MIKCDICIIGAGSGGLSVAAGASQMGARIVLIERASMGGDCLNYGCVPSKALLKAAAVAQTFRKAEKFGIQPVEPNISMKKVHDHVKGVIAGIAPNDSEERFESLGCTVIKEEACFVSPKIVQAGSQKITAKYFVIATGAKARILGIPGLSDVDFLTNETIFDQTELPEKLAIIGGGPIGCEMAQAHCRLGAKVILIDHSTILSRDDPQCRDIIRKRFIEEGIELSEHTNLKKIASITEAGKKKIELTLLIDGKEKEKKITASHLLMSTGRKACIDSLNLEKAGINYNHAGIVVDKRLRTSQKHIFAIGDCIGQHQFTHVAGYHAGIIIRNTLFRIPAKAQTNAIPSVTYTDPEMALVGLNENAAREQYGDSISVTTFPFAENDRARAERDTDGIIKVMTSKKGIVLGACITGPRAGELIGPWIFAVANKSKIGAMAAPIFPYPTLGEVSKRVAGNYFTPMLFSKRTRKIVRFILKLPF